MQAEAERLLRAQFSEIVHTLVTDSGLTPGALRRQAALFARVTRILNAGYGTLEAWSTEEFAKYAGVEALAARAQITALIADTDAARVTMQALTRAELEAIVELPIAGLPLGEWWKKQALDMSTATRQQMQLGLVAGESPAAIARRIVPPAGSSEATVLRRASNNANLLVRTSLTTVQNEAAFQQYQSANRDVSTEYQYVSARDNRVTPICRALDGNVYKYDDPKAPRPPQHIKCRSTIVPKLNWRALGVREPPAESALGFRSYDAWLREQSAGEQNRILTTTRADLWRREKVTLADLVSADRRVLTLDQLRDRIGSVDT